MKNDVTLLLVDDHPLLRHGLRDVIGKKPRFKIIGEASDGAEAMKQMAALKPQVVILDNAATDVVIALEKVERGESFISASMLEAGKRRSDRVKELLLSKPQIEALTPAERRILKLIGEDLTSKEIADRLKLSVRTVDNHRQHICNKLKLHGTHSLLKFAFDNSAYL